jgi:hypothetical protein
MRRIKWLIVSLAVAALPMCGAHKGRDLAPIALYTQFVQVPSAAVFDAMQREVESIMSPMDLRFRWKNLADATGREASAELAVADFPGRCDVKGLVARDLNPGPLGWTHISDGVILPFATIDCSAVRSFIQRELLDVNAESREEVFGRALGRVLAHELYHIFANTTRHGSDGVAREFYSVRDLISPTFQFEGRESLALLHSRTHARLANPLIPVDGDDTERH